MLKRPLFAVIFFSGIFIASFGYANEDKRLDSYIQQKFHDKLVITPQQSKQLIWVLDHTRRSNDFDMHIADPAIHIEVSRALTRLYCLQLLRSGTQQAYQQFIAAQFAQNDSSTLSFVSFTKLAKYIQNLNALDYEIIETATILSAVSLSEYAAKLANNLWRDKRLANDNQEFLAATLRDDLNIYPLAQHIVNDNNATQKLLYILFPPQTNFRHMLYTEGGVGMFKYMRSMIQHQYITQPEIDLWYAYWIVNTAGFRGHVAANGSIYLNEDVFFAMSNLKQNIDKLVDTPNYNPLLSYLDFRAELLGFKHLPEEQKYLLAHLGALLRMYTVADGIELQNAFKSLTKKQQQQIASYFQQSLQDNDMPTMRYIPALFANSIALSNGDVAKTLQVMLPFYSDLIELYSTQVRSGKLPRNIPLDVNQLSASKNLRVVLRNGKKAIKLLKIMPNGEVLLS